MTQVGFETLPIASASDIVVVRQKVRELSIQLKFTLVDQTKMVTAASELARNALEHGKGGTCRARSRQERSAPGLAVGVRRSWSWHCRSRVGDEGWLHDRQAVWVWA